MATATTPVNSKMDWRQEWFEFEGATYLNLAGQSPMPKAALKGIQTAMDAKKFPHEKPDSIYFDAPNRLRAGVARLIGAKADEIALTTGATSGMAAVAYGLKWQPGDEVITAKVEFPLQYTTWKPMEEREGIKVKVVAPREQFLTAQDLIDALTPKTRLVSVSLVRFDDGSMLDAARVAEACHKQGALLLLDISQACGAIPLDMTKLGADFAVCAGYKFLLGPFGTGFFWVKSEHIRTMRPAPFYWMAVAGSDNFAQLNFAEPKPAMNASRWDAPEWASQFNFNLMGLEASVEFVEKAGAETVAAHNHRLVDWLFERLPKDRCIVASPLERAKRGPFGCFVARTPEKTVALFRKLHDQKLIVALREGKIRVSPYLYNTEQDIDRLIAAVTA